MTKALEAQHQQELEKMQALTRLEVKLDLLMTQFRNHLHHHEKIEYAMTFGVLFALVLAIIKWGTGL